MSQRATLSLFPSTGLGNPRWSCKQRPQIVAAAAGIATVDGRTASKQRVGLGRPAVVLQWTEFRISHGHTAAADRTALGSHQVVTT